MPETKRKSAVKKKTAAKRSRKGKGTIIVIGGHEDKEGDSVILTQLADLVKGCRLVISTVASEEPEGYFQAYKKTFGRLGVKDLVELYIADRSESLDEEKFSVLKDSAGVFFTGGDQLRISSQIGDTPFEAEVKEVYHRGGVVAGTSAGASAMGESMLVRGTSGESSKIGEVHLSPGIGLIPNVIIDQHFAERGRIGRLLGAIALNPRLLGIGIDEDTAIVVKEGVFTVVGNGAVYIADGASVTHSNIAEGESNTVLTILDVKLHVLSSGDRYHLAKREVIPKRSPPAHKE